MTITYSAKKIIKNQRFIFRALPVLSVGLFVLTACGAELSLEGLSETQNDFIQAVKEISNITGGNANGNNKEASNEVTYREWKNAERPPAVPETGRFSTNFVQTTNKKISTEGITSTTEYSLNLDTTEFNGTAIGGDADDGFAFFQGDVESSTYHYAGIFDSTDLGAPLKQTSGSLMWNGVIGINDDEYSTKFTITFTDTGGMIEAFLPNINNTSDFLITGNFNTSGVIDETDDGIRYGTQYAEFAGNVPTSTTKRSGTLSGIIGSDGAVAVFYSEGYSGGFIAGPKVGENDDTEPTSVADPDPNKVTYSDWVRVHNPPAELDTSHRRAQFLQTTNKDISRDDNRSSTKYNLNLKTTKFEDTPISGDGDDGIIFFQEQPYSIINGYVGIYDSTDLGAPLTQTSGSLMWNGVIGLRDLEYPTKFTITFTDTGGKIEAFASDIMSDYDLLIAGTFDASGVISGNTRYAEFTDENDRVLTSNPNGALSGLIGSDGAVGGFYSVEILFAHYGGFVAGPNVIADQDLNKVEYNDWVRVYTPDAAPATSPRNQFLQTTAKDISTAGITSPAKYSFNLNTAEFRGTAIGGDANDGFALFQGDVESSTYHYAGIYDSTDLGAPLTPPNGTIRWNGVIGLRDLEYSTKFTITFTDTGGKFDAFASGISDSNDLLIAGTFDISGVITGNTHYAEFTNENSPVLPSTPNGVLSGLIGSGGAVGVFYGDDYAGGFVSGSNMVTDSDPNKVEYNDWVRVYNPDAVQDTTILSDQFLQTTNKEISTEGTTNIKKFSYNLSTAEFDGTAIGGDADDGFAYFFWQDSSNARYGASGIYDSTDLGAPLTQTSGTIMWNGFIGRGIFDSSAEFTITFTDTGGKIEALWESVYLGRHLLISGTFDTSGVISGNTHYHFSINPIRPVIPEDPNGVLSGLIGSGGAVGVFYSDSYSGGFIASPNVFLNATESKWDDSFYNSLGDGNSSFNQFSEFDAGNTFLENGNIVSNDNGQLGNIIPTNLKMSDATFGNPAVALGGDAGDAVAFVSGFYDSVSDNSVSGNRSFYAGINGAANLGKVLPAWQSGQTASAEWKGRFAAERGDGTGAGNTTNTDFTLEVNFENRAVEAFVPVASGSITHYHLQGSFAADEDGAIIGTVDRGDFTNGRTLTTSTNLPGIFTGLIGQEGALGVFISGTRTGTSTTLTGGQDDMGYAGGFVACPLHADGRCMSATR